MPPPKRSFLERLRRSFTYGQIGAMLARELRDCSSVIDVGCGTDSRLQYANFRGRTIGADAYPPALSPKHPLHDEYVRCDLRDFTYPEKSVDACVLLDVIEHLTKEDGWRLVDRLERIARKRVIVATPNGFLPQPPSADNPFQEHISGWETHELREQGYRIYGLSGYKPWRGEEGNVVAQPWPLFLALSKISEPFFVNRPEGAFALFCVKDLAQS
ncbi:MAG TPA: class I SAM-dependent methyltransferase [Verrucomicrobiae bacterium]|nr:class I SAM-dependent methyltransferase [Verrucomicrobiae bacterium]